MTEVVYYTCLNNECEKHRSVFIEGDPQHANCARERLHLEGERRATPWAPIIASAALSFAVVGIAAYLIVRASAQRKPHLPMIREESAIERPEVPADRMP